MELDEEESAKLIEALERYERAGGQAFKEEVVLVPMLEGTKEANAQALDPAAIRTRIRSAMLAALGPERLDIGANPASAPCVPNVSEERDTKGKQLSIPAAKFELFLRQLSHPTTTRRSGDGSRSDGVWIAERSVLPPSSPCAPCAPSAAFSVYSGRGLMPHHSLPPPSQAAASLRSGHGRRAKLGGARAGLGSSVLALARHAARLDV